MSGILRYLERLEDSEDQSKVESYLHDLLGEDECGDEINVPETKKARQDCPGHEANIEKQRDFDNDESMNALLKAIYKSPPLNAYQLQPNELMLIAKICHKTKANGEQDFNVSEICEMLPGMDDSLENQYAAIVDLIDREILSTPHLQGVDYHYDLRALYGTGLQLNGLLWNLILGKDPIKEGLKAFGKGLAKSESAMDSVLKMIGMLFLHYPELTDDFSSNYGTCYGRTVNLVFDAYLQAISHSKGAAGGMSSVKSINSTRSGRNACFWSITTTVSRLARFRLPPLHRFWRKNQKSARAM